jgi:hypothetical protein
MKFTRTVTKLFNTPLASPTERVEIFGEPGCDVQLEDLSASPSSFTSPHSRRSVRHVALTFNCCRLRHHIVGLLYVGFVREERPSVDLAIPPRFMESLMIEGRSNQSDGIA